jgi:hypothetical protein
MRYPESPVKGTHFARAAGRCDLFVTGEVRGYPVPERARDLSYSRITPQWGS